jgi:hypothetical protein
MKARRQLAGGWLEISPLNKVFRRNNKVVLDLAQREDKIR